MTKLVTSALLGLFLFFIPSGCAKAATAEDLVKNSYTVHERRGFLPVSVAPESYALAKKICKEAGLECRVVILPEGPLLMAGNNTIYMTPDIERYSSAEKAFFLAHEVGHLVLTHQWRITRTYQKYWPGELTPQLTNSPSSEMLAELSAVHKATELEADEFGVRMIIGLGYTKADAIKALRDNIVPAQSATHPDVFARIRNIETKMFMYK